MLIKNSDKLKYNTFRFGTIAGVSKGNKISHLLTNFV